MKPITTVSSPIEAEVATEESPNKELSNQRSKKAIEAQDERRRAREERSKQRDSKGKPPSSKDKSARKAQKSKNEDEQNPIQSKRTSGDGRTKKRRK